VTVPRVDKTEGPLNFLQADLKGRITDLGSLERATNAVGELQQVVKLRRDAEARRIHARLQTRCKPRHGSASASQETGPNRGTECVRQPSKRSTP